MIGPDPYKDLPVSATIPTRSEEMMVIDPLSQQSGSVQIRRGDQVFFQSRRGQPMRYVVNFEAVMGDTLRGFPGTSDIEPNVDAFRFMLLSLRDREGNYLVRNIPFMAILMDGADRRNRPKWWNFLPVDWETSYVQTTVSQNILCLIRVVFGARPR